MGGRGGAGGGKGGGRVGGSSRPAGSGGGVTLRLPALSGSEKQISWAKDILSNPYETMGARVKSFERMADAFDKGGKGYGDKERTEADAYKAAQKRYAEEIGKLKDMKASQIIDQRSGINTIANNIIKDEYRKRKLNPLNASKV